MASAGASVLMSADIFISYARADRAIVDQLAMVLKSAGLKIWWDADLLPGQQFANQIRDVLQEVRIVLAVLSPKALSSTWVVAELTYAHSNGITVVPVLVEGASPADLPVPFNLIQALVFDEAAPDRSANEIARQLVRLVNTLFPDTSPAAIEARRRLASAAASTARQVAQPEQATGQPPRSIFVVHGHDEGMLDAVTKELIAIGIEPVVLRRIRTSDSHLFAKFRAIAEKAEHAIVLISGDDVGASYRDFAHPAGGVARLEFRARQNVILELGFFYGRLSEERVFVFRKPPPVTERIVNKFDDPSDLAGKIFEDFDAGWQEVLRERLRQAGFPIGAVPISSKQEQ